MSFLNPILLAGLAAVAVPILIHLLNRRKFQKVVWAAMRFLQASIEKNKRRMQLEDLILLALRCLLLALLALALARPALLSDATDLFGQSKVTGVIVLDNSYSMGMSDGTRTRFEKAKETAEQALDSLAPGSAIAVLLASDIAQPLIPEPTFDLNLARKLLREAPLTDRPSDLFPAIDQALASLQGRLALRKEVFVITDGQAAGWRQLAQLQTILERSRQDIKTHLILINEAEPNNLALSDLRLASGLSPINQPLRFEARVSNLGQSEARQIRVSLQINQDPPSDEISIDTLAPGASRSVSLFSKLRDLGFHAVTASIPKDRLQADDSRTLAVRAIQQIRLLLVDGEPNQESRDSETFFLRHALTPVAPDRAQDYFIKTTILPSPELTQARLDDYDAVLLANVPDLAESTLKNLEQYLRRGGGLMVFTGARVNTAFYNEQLFQRYLFLPAALEPPQGDADQDTLFAQFQDKDYAHPITTLWNDPASGTLGSAKIFRRHRLLPAPDAPQPSLSTTSKDAGEAKIVLRYADGTPAIMERSWGLGRVLLFSSTADTAWNDLPVRPSFLPLLHRCLGALVQRQDEGLTLNVGEPFRRRIGPEFLGKDAAFLSPRRTEGVQDLRRVELMNDQPTLQYTATDYAGLYEASIADPQLALRFATQADARESSLDVLSPAQITTLKDVANVLQWSPGFSLKNLVELERTGLEFWLPVAVLVLLLAWLETFLAQWFSRSK